MSRFMKQLEKHIEAETNRRVAGLLRKILQALEFNNQQYTKIEKNLALLMSSSLPPTRKRTAKATAPTKKPQDSVVPFQHKEIVDLVERINLNRSRTALVLQTSTLSLNNWLDGKVIPQAKNVMMIRKFAAMSDEELLELIKPHLSSRRVNKNDERTASIK